mgnify:FL=1
MESTDLVDSLNAKIDNYDETLTFELNYDSLRQFEFIISCGGVRKGIPSFEKLVSAAPPTKTWKMFKYRKPKKINLF